MEIKLNGKVALVTGGSSGIGEACVRLLRKCGAHVVFTSHTRGDNAAKIALETGATQISCDVSQESECRAAVESAVAQHEAIDILINNAGIYMSSAAGERDFTDVWKTVLATNLDSSAYTTHYAAPFLKAKGGKIVNISSIHSVAGTANSSAYHSSKAAMDGLTRSLAVE